MAIPVLWKESDQIQEVDKAGPNREEKQQRNGKAETPKEDKPMLPPPSQNKKQTSE